MAFFRRRAQVLSFALLLSSAVACGDETEPDGDEPTEEEPPEEEEPPVTGKMDSGAGGKDSGPSNTRDDGGAKADAGDSTKQDGGGAVSDGGLDGGSKPSDAGTKDAATQDAATQDSGAKNDAGTTPPKSDAGTGSGVCDDKTPHGCYTPASSNPAGCPAVAPEVPFLIPLEWDLCNGGKVGPSQACLYNGPTGGSVNCLCDLGAHWLCVNI
jgi:hypothetical protein